jgi:hypothetical protein
VVPDRIHGWWNQLVAIEKRLIQRDGLWSLMQTQDGFSNYGSNLRKNVRFEPNPIVKVSIRVSRVEMNAKNGALDTRILTAADPCAVFPKNSQKEY